MPNSPNSPTIREQITAYILTALAAIQQGQPVPNSPCGATFQQSVDEVYNTDISADENMASDIVLGVFVQGDSTQSTLTKLSHGLDCPASLVFGIRAIIRGGVENIETVKSQLVADIKRALWARLDFNLSIYCVCLKSMAFNQEYSSYSGSGALGMFLASISIDYRYDPRNP